MPEGTDYAVSGIPVLRAGKACTTAQAKGQGWDTSPLRATWHTLVGLKGDGKIYVMGWQSRTANLLDSGEAARVFRGWVLSMCSSWTAAGATTRAGTGRSPRPRKTGGSTAYCAGR